MCKFDGLTRIITDSMNGIASGAVQISKVVQDVSELSHEFCHQAKLVEVSPKHRQKVDHRHQ